jgi:hypothetical protein
MFQSRWVRVLIKILLIWLVITLYFYFQQPVTYRFTGLNASFPIGKDQLIINEISVNNLDEEKIDLWNGKKIPWQYRMIEELHVPRQWYNTIFKVISFYSRPPLSNEYGSLKIYGTYISQESIKDIDLFELHERMDVYIYPSSGGSGMASTPSNYENALVICAHGKFPLKDLDKPVLLYVTDKRLSKSTTLLITPQWQKERIKRLPTLKDPAEPVSEYIHKIYESGAQNASGESSKANGKTQPYLAGKNIQIEAKLKWIDIFEGYYGVYQVDDDIYEYAESNGQKKGSPDKITFYIHQNNEGVFEVIYYTLEHVRTKE